MPIRSGFSRTWVGKKSRQKFVEGDCEAKNDRLLILIDVNCAVYDVNFVGNDYI